MINCFKLFSLPNYSVLNRIPNNDIWLQTEYQLFGCNPDYNAVRLKSLNFPDKLVHYDVTININFS